MRATLLGLVLAVATSPLAAQDGAMDAALAHFQAGRFQEAAAAFQAIVDAEPENAVAWLRLGSSHQELGNWAAARAALQKALDDPATGPGARIRLARVALGEGDPREAVAQLEALGATGFANAEVLRGVAAFAALAEDPAYQAVLADMDARRYPCRTTPEARQLDFWLGTWDVTAGGQHAGTNVITEILGQCVLLEEWSGAGGTAGKSMNYYDASRGHWRQIWVADNGNVLEYTGRFEDGAMRFHGVTVDSTGAETLQKLTFVPVAPDTVRQVFEASEDGGKTWQVTWEGVYVRRK